MTAIAFAFNVFWLLFGLILLVAEGGPGERAH
jgi:hypothetical protein